MTSAAQLRSYRAGDGAAIADAWTAAAPADPITAGRFRDLILLDRNFDPEGLFVAENDGRIVGAVYAVRRRIAFDGDDLEPHSGWIPFFFVRPEHRRQGLANALFEKALAWLRGHGITSTFFSSYTPNYFLPGLDVERYPEAQRLLERLGFRRQYEAVAMTADLTRYAPPPTALEQIASLEQRGYRFGSPTADDLVELIDVAGRMFNPDWARGIREVILQGLDLEHILACWAPAPTSGPDGRGELLGWAMHGAYEGMLERFGPFGVVPESRGLGLGKALLHLTLQRMRAFGGQHAWFLWTGEDSPAGILYLHSGFTIFRRFTVMRREENP